MKSAGRPGGQYRPLSQSQLETIHQASLQILEQTGFTFEAGLDDTPGPFWRARAAPWTGPYAGSSFPAPGPGAGGQGAFQVVLCGRREGTDLDLGEDRVHLGTGGSALNILDLESGAVRKTVLRDIHDIGRLVDRLENIHFYLRPCIPHDIPDTAYDVNSLYACLRSRASTS